MPMLELLQAPAQSTIRPSDLSVQVRAVRPSLLDPRFTGDPWVVDQGGGNAAVCLDEYLLTSSNT